jgi:hypothetical protein
MEAVLKIRSAAYNRVHEYRVGPKGLIQHRWTLENGGELPDGSSKWIVASKDFIRADVFNARRNVAEWFRAKGITFEHISALIRDEQSKKTPTRDKGISGRRRRKSKAG